MNVVLHARFRAYLCVRIVRFVTPFSPTQLLGTLRGTKINPTIPTTAAAAAASINTNTRPIQGVLSPSMALSVVAPRLSEGRRSYSEEGGGGDRPLLTDNISAPPWTEIDEVPPQSGHNKRETIMVGPGSSSYREKQQKHHQSWSGSSRAGNHGADPVVSTPVSAPLQSMLLTTEWMETEWKAIPQPVEVASGSRSMPTTTGMQPIHPPPEFADDNSTPLRMVGAKLLGDATTATTDRAAPSSPPTERWRGELTNSRMWGGRGGGGAGIGDSSPTPVVSPGNRTAKNSENLLVPPLTDSRRTPTGREVKERGEGVACESKRDEDNTAKSAVAGPPQAKQEDDDDGWEGSGRRYSGSPPPSPDAWTPATGKRPLFSGGGM